MKKLFVVLICIVVAGCAKDDIDTFEFGDNSSGVKKIIIPGLGKSGSLEILEFDSLPLFLSTLESLEILMEAHVENFVSSNSTLDEEALNELIIETSWDGEQPLKNLKI